jgi:chemotaxis protein methyltransferase CheR
MMIEEVVPVEVVRRFRHVAASHLGLDIDTSLEPMISARISKRLAELQLSLHSYLSRLQQDTTGEEVVAFWDFVRPRPAHFFARWADCRRLSTRIGKALDQGGRRFRLWSAGCGSGEEAYTMAMVAHHAIETAGIAPQAVDLKILATDISPRMLEVGKRGLFAGPQIWDVPQEIRQRTFVETDAGFQISDEIYSRVVFRQLNLGMPPFPMTGKLDAIFCEEGLQSLVPQAQRRAIKAARGLLADDGLIRTGLDEELIPQDDEYGTPAAAPSRSGSPTTC